jgi:hypothetical protein
MAAAKSAAARPPTNLPALVSEQIGRDHNLGKILSLTAAHRLVTLTGPGGIGKTRLAPRGCGSAIAALRRRRVAGRVRTAR